MRLVIEHRQEYPSMTEAMVAVSKQLNVSRESVRRIDAGRREGTTTQESEEIKKLRAENRRLREDVAVLKTATTSSRGAIDPRNR
jgi:transposase-like protein